MKKIISLPSDCATNIRLFNDCVFADHFVGSICPQYLESTRATYFPFQIDDDSMNEDCLYLNVWTPTTNPGKLLPVMVWIHGGAFIQGEKSSVDICFVFRLIRLNDFQMGLLCLFARLLKNMLSVNQEAGYTVVRY